MRVSNRIIPASERWPDRNADRALGSGLGGTTISLTNYSSLQYYYYLYHHVYYHYYY